MISPHIQQFEVEVLGAILTINSFLPLLRKGLAKKVISLGSFVADLDFTNKSGIQICAGYSISKSALNMVNKKYAIALQEEGFIFLSLSPGVVSTGGMYIHYGLIIIISKCMSFNLPPFVSVAPSDPDKLEALRKFVTQIKTVERGFAGPITPEESVKAMTGIIDTLKPEENGMAISHLRSSEKWL